MKATPRVGTAGWTIPRAVGAAFAGEGTHLQRYARVFNAAEINSSFYRSHTPQTYERWAASVPAGFRFAVKLPREITHTRKLVGAARVLNTFLGEVRALEDRLGPLLVQLPPSLAYGAAAPRFFAMLRDRFDGDVVCEPRHPSWFAAEADETLRRFRVARVIADPPRVPAARAPGGWRGLVYRRLHGSPRVYWSAYTADIIDAVAADMARKGRQWCIFDNTASGAAAANALDLARKVAISGARRKNASTG